MNSFLNLLHDVKRHYPCAKCHVIILMQPWLVARPRPEPKRTRHSSIPRHRPIIHALQCLPKSQRMILHNLLAQRKVDSGSSLEHKQLILQLMQRSGSLEYTLKA